MRSDREIEALLGQTDWLRSLARHLVRDAEARDDVVQETICSGLGRLREIRNLRAWLFGTMSNIARAGGRADARRERTERGAAVSERCDSAADLAARAELQRELTDLVLRLPPRTRDAILLRFFEDLEPAEIAVRTGEPAATVRSRIHRGLERLRRELDRKSGGDRSRWMHALAPLAFPPVHPSPLASLVGTLAMKTKLFAAAAVALAAVALWPRRDDPRPGIPETPPQAQMRTTPDVAGSVRDPVPSETAAVVAGDRPAAFVPLPEVALSGVVLDGETSAPVANASILAELDRPPGTRLGETRSGEDGTYRLVGLVHKEPLRIRVERQGYAPDVLVVTLPAPGTHRRDLIVQKGGGYVGFVRDVQTLSPVPDARVLVSLTEATRTDANGRFELRGIAGTATLRIEKDGWCRTEMPLAAVAPGETRELDVFLVEGGTVTGRLVDGKGDPVAGGIIDVLSFEKPDLDALRARYAGRPPPSAVVGSRPVPARARTDAEGFFEIRGLLPIALEHHVYGSPPDSDSGVLGGRIRFDRPGEVRRLDIRLHRTGSIEGRLLLDGAPARGLLVWRGGGSAGEIQAAADGSFFAERVAAGEVEITASAYVPSPSPPSDGRPILASRTHRVTVTPGETTPCEFDIRAERNAVGGRVFRPDGAPAPLVPLRVRSGDRHDYRTRSDGEGAFEVVLPEAAGTPVRIIASSGPLDVGFEAALGDTRLRLELPDTATVSVLVLAPDGRVVTRPAARWRRAGTAEWTALDMYAFSAPDPSGPPGSLALTLPRERIELQFSAEDPGDPRAVVPVDLRSGSTGGTIRVELGRRRS